MPSEKQVRANRRNSARSSGPRSVAGKRHAARNALRHGLTRSLTSVGLARRVEKLARRIAGDSSNILVLELARTAAEAELELERVRRTRIALIEHAQALGALEPAKHFPTAMQAVKWCQRMFRWTERPGRIKPPNPVLIDPLASMPETELDRPVEGVRRALPELQKLARYEIRATSRRDQAIRKMLEMKTEADRAQKA
jgi:hypothetical protein